MAVHVLRCWVENSKGTVSWREWERITCSAVESEIQLDPRVRMSYMFIKYQLFFNLSRLF
jgi:hypothetical protein